MTRLSVLDLATVAQGSSAADALADTTRLARIVETLGYHRLWVAEHHGMPSVASSAPAVLVGHLADATTTLRVGAGGVMLPNHAPLVVAEQFATLEALHPGRIDLGLGRAPGTDPATARALRRSADLGAEHFPQDVVELLGYLVPSDGPPTVPAPVPGRGYLPQVWLLGLVDLQRPTGRPAGPALQLRVPLRPGFGRRGRRPLPVELPPHRPAGRALRDGGRLGPVRRLRRRGPVPGRPVGAGHAPPADRATVAGRLPRGGRRLPLHRGGAGARRVDDRRARGRRPGHRAAGPGPRWSSAPGPTS